MAPPGNQAATEKTNINLYHSENPVYSPKVGPFKCGFLIAEFGIDKKAMNNFLAHEGIHG